MTGGLVTGGLMTSKDNGGRLKATVVDTKEIGFTRGLVFIGRWDHYVSEPWTGSISSPS